MTDSASSSPPTMPSNPYLRHPIIRALRWLVINLWIGVLIAYLATVVILAVQIGTSAGPRTFLDGRSLLHIVLLTPLIDHPWWVNILLAIVSVMFLPYIVLRYIAAEDRDNERYIRKIEMTFVTTEKRSRALLAEWDADRPQREAAIPVGMVQQLTLTVEDAISSAWSLDGRWIAVGTFSGNIIIFDAVSGTPQRTLIGHSGSVEVIGWSPNGKYLASGSRDKKIKLWNAADGDEVATLRGHTQWVLSIAWSPDGQQLASSSNDKTIKLWDPLTFELITTINGHEGQVNMVVWSPDGSLIASASSDKTVRLWDVHLNEEHRVLQEHTDDVLCLAWSSDGRLLVSGGADRTIRIWEVSPWQCVRTLEILSGDVVALTFIDAEVIAAHERGRDSFISIWDISTGEKIAGIPTIGNDISVAYILCGINFFDLSGIFLQTYELDRALDFGHSIAITLDQSFDRTRAAALDRTQTKYTSFHQESSILLTPGDRPGTLQLWKLDLAALLSQTRAVTTQYTNARAILIGESAVGKTGLGLALSQEGYRETDSTHGRHVWLLDERTVALAPRRNEQRELLLWDMAGQQGYRVVHQLYLDDVAVALVVFDGRSETDPFAGVYYWERALRQARALQGTAARPQRRFLVSARVDRGGIGVSQARIDEVVRELGFDGYFATSARTGEGIAALRAAIEAAVSWEAMLKVTSSELFQGIKQFLVDHVAKGDLPPLLTTDALYAVFLQAGIATETTQDLRIQFEIAIDRVEQTGLLKRLSFGSLVLLQPELLDSYASSLVLAVRDEPDGLGNIAEADVLGGSFKLLDDRMPDRGSEQLLLIAMVEDLLRRELALREGPDLVFPAQTTVTYPVIPNVPGKTIVFDFAGPINNLYATLAVRLLRSTIFTKRKIWRDAIEYSANVGGLCGLYLERRGEGLASLTLFFGDSASEETRYTFEDYVARYLYAHAIDVHRDRIFTCPNCGVEQSRQATTKRRELGYDFIVCNVCEAHISLADGLERLAAGYQSRVDEIDHLARQQRERDLQKTRLDGRRAVGDYDVFICFNVEDYPAIRVIADQLEEHDILPWIFKREQRPGTDWLEKIQEAIGKCKTGAVFAGDHGIGQWQHDEISMLVAEEKQHLGFLTIPVILPGTEKMPNFPRILKARDAVDFRLTKPDPLERLMFGITGKMDW